jgi:beta-glucanase (GH16 family)
MRQILVTLATVAVVSAAETLIFEDNFDTLNLKTWEHELTLGGGGNWEFQWYVNNRTNSYTKDGVLYIKPTYTEDAVGTTTLYNGDINIWGGSPADTCTSNAFYGCERNAAASGNVNNPIRSARLRTTNSFSTKYGRVEVTAQLPVGDWLWPAIWMLPRYNDYGNWPASGEIDIMESRGNDLGYPDGGHDSFGSTLHWGTNWDQNKYKLTHAEKKYSQSLAAGMHVYGLYWD